MWVGALARARCENERAVLVTVAHTAGSAPREAGAAMVVTKAAIDGTIGGGHLEFEATRIARDALANRSAPESTWIVRFPLSARLGQCCGGVATLAFSVVPGASQSWLDAALACARTGIPFALLTRVGGVHDAHSRLLVTADDAHGTLGDAGLESIALAMGRARLETAPAGACLAEVAAAGAATLLVHIERPDAFPVFVFGNGHVGRALVQVLGALPACVRWIDTREDDFPAAVPGNAEVVATEAPEEELAHAPQGAFVVVMTHSHRLDFALIEAALARDDWRYLGLIGSGAKRTQFEARLAARGIAPERIARMVCPIGVGGGIAIRSKEPGAIAVAVAAEIVAARDAGAFASGRTMHRLSDRRPFRKSRD